MDQDIRRAEREAMDMMHGQPYMGHVSVQKGDYPDRPDWPFTAGLSSLTAAVLFIVAASILTAILVPFF